MRSDPAHRNAVRLLLAGVVIVLIFEVSTMWRKMEFGWPGTDDLSSTGVLANSFCKAGIRTTCAWTMAPSLLLLEECAMTCPVFNNKVSGFQPQSLQFSTFSYKYNTGT
jgi:hypothetical protein